MFDERERRLFEQEMADVTPLPKNPSSAHSASVSQARYGSPELNTPTESQLARRISATASQGEHNFLSDEFVDLLRHDEPVSFKKEGIQTGVLQKLEHGHYAVESQLNLLGTSLHQCRQEVFNFIRDAQYYQLRSLMIIHGRGRKDDSKANILRSYIVKWLNQFEEVQAYCSAQARLGGVGATCIVLKKSEKARQKNRERHLDRRRG